jgi:mannose-6-phosphate isomerase
VHPLRFEPIFKDYIWGGERLHQILGKDTGPGTWAESWEIVDHINGQSVVRDGLWKGKSLGELLRENGNEIVGPATLEKLSGSTVPDNLRGRFPLLLKFLDASQVLSVQVHPDDTMGATLSPPDLGKTEAWYVIDATPDAKIFAGLKSGVTRQDLKAAIEKGETEEVLHSFTPAAGDCVFIEAGTVHAIGAGLLVCEIQQASDTTFRLFDWDRVGNDGQPRPLHVQQGLQAINFELGPIAAAVATSVDEHRENLVTCDKFILDRSQISSPQTLGGDGKFRIIAVIDGTVSLSNDPCSQPMSVGQSALIPACCDSIAVTPTGPATILEIRLP